ncbi:MAG: hypothetical protein RLZZ214_3914 [Verrucomicrobiota bacterium]
MQRYDLVMLTTGLGRHTGVRSFLPGDLITEHPKRLHQLDTVNVPG